MADKNDVLRKSAEAKEKRLESEMLEFLKDSPATVDAIITMFLRQGYSYRSILSILKNLDETLKITRFKIRGGEFQWTYLYAIKGDLE